MKRHLPVLCLVLVLFSGTGHAENYARVCVSVLDADANETLLDENASPASGRKIVVHLEANKACTVLIVPVIENGKKLANGWRPQMVEVGEWEETVLPDSRSSWNWNSQAKPFELWVFFFKPDMPVISTFRTLVAAMQSPSVNEQILSQQTTKLCELLGDRITGSHDIVNGPKADAALIAGSVRSADFPWRDFAHKVVLNDALEGGLVVRHGR